MGNWGGFEVKTHTWKERLSEMGEDIAEYLERRYEDYCRDKNEKSSASGGEAQLEREIAKQKQLIEFGITLKEKLSFFLDESRRELFGQIYERNEAVDSFFKRKYKGFCKELEENNKALPLYKQKDSYTLHIEKSDKEKQLFEYKEIMKNNLFIENIDKRRADYEKKKAERERRNAEEEAKKKVEAERFARNEKKKGFTNVKPLSFYEELYIKNDSPFNYGDDVDESKFDMEVEQEYDIYFEENGSPKGTWKTYRTGSFNERKYWTGDNTISNRRPEEYTSADTPENNQIYLDRCKEITNILVNLNNSEDNQLQLRHIEILQKYLIKGYLITRQIACFVRNIKYTLIEELSIDPNNPNRIIQNHSIKEYEIGIYDNDFNIEKIKEDVDEFIRINEGMILTPFECLVVYLKKHDDIITIKEYASFINNTNIVARRILNEFAEEKKLKYKKVGRRHELVYFI